MKYIGLILSLLWSVVALAHEPKECFEIQDKQQKLACYETFFEVGVGDARNAPRATLLQQQRELTAAVRAAIHSPEAICTKAHEMGLIEEVGDIEECKTKLEEYRQADKALYDKLADCVVKATTVEDMKVCNKK